MPKILITLLLFLSSFCINAQNCGTEITKAHKEFMQGQIFTSLEKSAPVPRLNKTLSVTVHIAQDKDGNLTCTEEDVEALIEYANTLFEPIKLSFQVCKVDYMPNYNFYDLIREDFEEEMLTMHYQDNTINLYLVNSIDEGASAGYTTMPSDVANRDFVVLGSQKPIGHELGHYFGLYHTHETMFGIELVNGSNCEEAGDLICDTDADPYTPGIQMDSMDVCNILENLVDPNMEFYVPPTNNIMSYYPANCRCIFTNQQYNRMAETYLNSRSYLW